MSNRSPVISHVSETKTVSSDCPWRCVVLGILTTGSDRVRKIELDFTMTAFKNDLHDLNSCSEN